MSDDLITAYEKRYQADSRDPSQAERLGVWTAAWNVATQATGLTFGSFRAANVSRCEKWHPAGIGSWSPSDWLTAAMGELGELASEVKMHNRVRDGLAGNKEELSPNERRRRMANEAADVVTYLDLFCAERGIDLGDALIRKFNEVSERVGFPERLAAAPVTAAPAELSSEFTDTARAAIAWVLWHHQGASSPVGQPLRFALGMGADEPLPDWRIAEAKRYAEWAGATTAKFHEARPSTPAAPGIDLREHLEDRRNRLMNSYGNGAREDSAIDAQIARIAADLALLDASPKGALNEQFGSAEGFKAHLAEFIKLGRRLVSALYNSPRDEISMTDTGDWIQYASQLLQLDKAKGGSDLIECVDRIEEAIEHRVPHDIYGAVRVELAEIRHLAQVSSPKGGSEARDSVLAALVEAATAVERADADGELTDDLVDRLRAARDAAQAGYAEVQP